MVSRAEMRRRLEECEPTQEIMSSRVERAQKYPVMESMATMRREREALETALLFAEALEVCHRECNVADCPFGDAEKEDCGAREWLRGEKP